MALSKPKPTSKPHIGTAKASGNASVKSAPAPAKSTASPKPSSGGSSSLSTNRSSVVTPSANFSSQANFSSITGQSVYVPPPKTTVQNYTPAPKTTVQNYTPAPKKVVGGGGGRSFGGASVPASFEPNFSTIGGQAVYIPSGGSAPTQSLIPNNSTVFNIPGANGTALDLSPTPEPSTTPVSPKPDSSTTVVQNGPPTPGPDPAGDGGGGGGAGEDLMSALGLKNADGSLNIPIVVLAVGAVALVYALTRRKGK